MKDFRVETNYEKFFSHRKYIKEFLNAQTYPFKELMAFYKCAMMEIETKLNVLNEQFSLQYDRNPINSIKTRLKSRILGFEKNEVEEKITPKSGADEMYLQRAGKRIRAMEIEQVSLQSIRISDKLDTQGNKSTRPIWCDASLVITECKAQNKSIFVRGEATVKCICHSEDGEITFSKWAIFITCILLFCTV